MEWRTNVIDVYRTNRFVEWRTNVIDVYRKRTQLGDANEDEHDRHRADPNPSRHCLSDQLEHHNPDQLGDRVGV